VASHHYEDSIVRFRARRPTYQREWRFLRSLREIRDAIAPALSEIASPLNRLSSRGEELLATHAVEQETRPRHAKRGRFVDAVKIGRRVAALVGELTLLIRQLDKVDRS